MSSGAIAMKRRLDREGIHLQGRDLHPFTLKVKDELNRTAVTALKLTVQDVNDNVPTFSAPVYRIFITENTTYGRYLQCWLGDRAVA